MFKKRKIWGGHLWKKGNTNVCISEKTAYMVYYISQIGVYKKCTSLRQHVNYQEKEEEKNPTILFR